MSKIDITHIKYTNKKLPASFAGYKILHISDLHNRSFGTNQSELITHTQKIRPNIIAITGDLIDSDRPNIDAAMAYVSAVKNIAPVLYVSGNNECKSGVYAALWDRLNNTGVNILDEQSLVLQEDSNRIRFIGLRDPVFDDDACFEKRLESLTKDRQSDFLILLSHRPEKIDLYRRAHIDLALTGHAHGGQFRLPLVGGLYAPDQGVFPRYTSGLYIKGNTSMVVSRGLGNSGFPFRLNNRPELVVITLNHASADELGDLGNK